MTIRNKLILNVALTTAGIALILAVSIFAILKIRSSVLLLTGKSTPLQIKTLELQQIIEKISADLMRLGLSTKENEAKEVSQTIENELRALHKVNREIQALNTQTSKADVAVFNAVYKTVSQTVKEKIRNIGLFMAETKNVNVSFGKVEAALSSVKGNIARLNLDSRGEVASAQESGRNLNTTIKKLLAIQSILKDVKMSMTEISTVINKYKLNPLKERVKAFSGSVQAVRYNKGEPEIIKEAKDEIMNMCEQITRDGSGLIALKSASFGDADAERAFSTLKNNISSSLDSLSSRMTEVIDGFEIRILKEKEDMDKTYIVQTTAEKVTEIGSEVNADMKELASDIRLVMLSQSVQELAGAISETERVKDGIQKNINQMKALLRQQETVYKNAQAEEKVGLRSLFNFVTFLTESMTQTMSSVSGPINSIIHAKKEVLSSDLALQKSIDTIKDVSLRQSREGEQQVKTITQKQHEVVADVGNTVMTSLIFMVVASTVILFIVVTVNSKTAVGIIKPLKYTEEMISFVERGDLTKKIEVTGKDEIGRMCSSFNGLIEKLHETISDISRKAQIIREYAETVSTAVAQQASFSSELSGSVAEISSTMEEFSATSTQIADHSGSVFETATGSLDKTKEGAGAVGTIANKLNEINMDNQNNIEEVVGLGKKSKEITGIMEIINNIADRTKLIAFNAALEAASAGEAGKRFGVVAVEIRRLADSVMESTDEIEGKIHEILEAVNRLVISSEKGSKSIRDGLDYSSRTVLMLEDIVEEVKKTTDAAKHISLSTQQQKTASAQVSTAVREIAAGAGQASDSIGQITSISNDLAQLSEDLKRMVEKFNL